MQCPNCHCQMIGSSGICKYCGHNIHNKTKIYFQEEDVQQPQVPYQDEYSADNYNYQEQWTDQSYSGQENTYYQEDTYSQETAPEELLRQTAYLRQQRKGNRITQKLLMLVTILIGIQVFQVVLMLILIFMKSV